MTTPSGTKVTAEHLRRHAYLYVRQSSLQQVHDHRESTARQYDLKRRAQALGWATEQIVVIDDDLGLSGASAAERRGFQRLVAEVGLGRVGLVMGLEVSRLARNSSDWHRLLEICALAETLILDEDGIYDPSHFNDRLLLGLKGTMSEAELHVLRARLLGGLLNKARRGGIVTREAATSGEWRLFYDMFEEQLRRLAVPGFGWAFFHNIRERLSDKVRIRLAWNGKACVGGVLLFCHRPTIYLKQACTEVGMA